MDSVAVSWVMNVLMGFIMYLMKISHDSTKEAIKSLQEKQDRFQNDYLKKTDFKEFKEELWDRIDDLKVEIRAMGNK